MTFIADNFSMQKSLSKTLLDIKSFICKPIFKIFVAHFRTKGMLNHGKMIHV